MSACKVKMGNQTTKQLSVEKLADGNYGICAVEVAKLCLDTSCFQDPCIKLDFVTNLSAIGVNTGTLLFQVYKKCDHEKEATELGPSWAYGPIEDGSDIISFFVSDCEDDDCCPSKHRCCTYTVVVTGDDFDVDAVHLITLTSMLSATMDDCSECSCKRR